ncbi:MAG: hypothetical protein JSV52_07020 [Candidatus Zixiibacteriota bacterium]|nr:MAG: hypothetical protein JSV52_07020 [candidate division Zixibacteria bacterium]
MSRLSALAVIFLFAASSASASGFVELGREAKIPLADRWVIVDDTGGFPYRLSRTDQSAELSIFKSIIAADEKIKNEQELKLSVDKVIEDVILGLPEANLLANTGYFDKNRVWFDLDFESWDPERELQIRHRLKGVLYQHPDGHQLLFSLWGKAIEGAPASALYEMRLMQDEFAYTGDVESEVFGSSFPYDWYLIGFLFALLVVMLFILKKRQRQEKIAFSDEANFWRCDCGRLNHVEFDTCRRCGRPQPVEEVS